MKRLCAESEKLDDRDDESGDRSMTTDKRCMTERRLTMSRFYTTRADRSRLVREDHSGRLEPPRARASARRGEKVDL